MRESLPSFEAILLGRFAALAPLDESESVFLTRIANRARDNHGAGARIWSDASPSRHPSVILSGWACATREGISGTRQIVEILLPGDLIGFGVQLRPVPAATVVALTPIRAVAAAELAAVWANRHLTPRMAARLEAMLAEQHFLLTSQVARLGRASAYGRVANLMAELHWRLEQRSLAEGAEFPMPLTQEQIADTVGLSVVHVNRTLQQLRREGRLVQEKAKVRLLDLEGVYAAGEFMPPRIAPPETHS